MLDDDNMLLCDGMMSEVKISKIDDIRHNIDKECLSKCL